MDLNVRYASSIDRAKLFLEGKKKTAKGTAISQTNQLKLLQHRADCPLCGVVFEGTNHNTEHIHPRSLGGTNDVNNKIQLCKNCNNCRNSILQRMLPPPPFHKSYPENWDIVRDLIVWSELTVDDGLGAGIALPDVHEKFLEERFAGETPNRGPQRAFGRASTLDDAKGPNYPHNKKAENSAGRGKIIPSSKEPRVEKKGFWQRYVVPILDRATGYGADSVANRTEKKSESPMKTTPDTPPNAPEPKPDAESAKSAFDGNIRFHELVSVERGERVRRDLRGLSFEQSLSVVLASNRVPLAVFAGWVIGDLKHFGIVPEGEHYLSHFGYSKSKGLRKILQEDFGEMFRLDEVEGVWYIEGIGQEVLKSVEQYFNQNKINGLQIELLEFWEFVAVTIKPKDSPWSLFLKPFAIKSKGTVLSKIFSILDRTNLVYSIDGESPNHVITVSSVTQFDLLEAETATVTSTTPNAFPKVDDIFKQIVLDVISKEEGKVRLTTISQRVSKHLASMKSEPMSFKKFAKHHGIPSRYSLVDIIEHYFSDSLAYKRQGDTLVFVWRIDHEEE